MCEVLATIIIYMYINYNTYLQQIGECLTLTEEFRQLSEKHVNREDKLQVSICHVCVV